MPETPKFNFRIPPGLRAELERAAAEETRTLTNLIIHALWEWLSGRGRPKQP